MKHIAELESQITRKGVTPSKQKMDWIKFALEELSCIDMDPNNNTLTTYFIGLCYLSGIRNEEIASYVYGRKNISRKRINECVRKTKATHSTAISEAVKFVMDRICP